MGYQKAATGESQRAKRHHREKVLPCRWHAEWQAEEERYIEDNAHRQRPSCF